MNPGFEIIVAGSLVAISCSLLGCFLILRKMAMVGDAISHAVLPGIVIAFLLTGSRDSVTMLLGAAVMGVISTYMIEFFHQKARLQTDAAIGISFTSLFAVGIILISIYAGKVDLDQECVLYGDIDYIPLDRVLLHSGLDLGPRAIWILGGVMMSVLLFIIICYKALFLTTFDPAYAAAIGISTALWHYLLMGMVSVVTVASFESVGAILVVAFLVGPPASAYLLTNKLPTMLILSAVLGIIASGCGYFLALVFNASTAGAMTVIIGLEFVLALLFSPLSGLLLQSKKQ